MNDPADGSDNKLPDMTSGLYSHLRELAGRCMGGAAKDHTLQATALVHEAWLKLAKSHPKQDHDRIHFLSVAACAMRQVLVDHARGANRNKRSPLGQRIALDEGLRITAGSAVDILEFEEIHERLRSYNSRLGKLVELRIYGGLTIDESAVSLGVSPATVSNDWRLARVWLTRELGLGDLS